jgi:hypothetical protein
MSRVWEVPLDVLNGDDATGDRIVAQLRGPGAGLSKAQRRDGGRIDVPVRADHWDEAVDLVASRLYHVDEPDRSQIEVRRDLPPD